MLFKPLPFFMIKFIDHFFTITFSVLLSGSILNAQQGSLDFSFGNQGKTVASINNNNELGSSVIIQQDGKLLVGGFCNTGNNNDFALMRFNVDGTIDNSFDFDGSAVVPIGTGDDVGYNLALQSDGKILLAGSTFNLNKYNFGLIRFNADGSLDNTFGGSGIVSVSFGNSNDICSSVAIQQDGKIVMTGISDNGSDYDVALARLNADGSLDDTFSSDGKLTTAIGNLYDYGNGLIIQPDGKIVITVFFNGTTNLDLFAVRYLSNGVLDNTFGSNGITVTDFGEGTNNYVYCGALQTDGKILMGGYSDGSNEDFGLIRLNADGSLDNTFDGDGKLTSQIGTGDDKAKSIALQVDGKIILAGQSFNGTDFDYALIRYNTDGSLDNSFDTDGKQTTDIAGFEDNANGILVQPNGKIVLAGHSKIGTINKFSIARYNACSSFQMNQTVNLCYGENLTVGNIIHSSSGTFNDTLTTLLGCDSIVTSVLNINPSINVNTSVDGNIITAIQNSANYQWLNCNTGNAIITNATNQIFSVTQNGSFAVVVSIGACSDTSACVDFNSVGINESIPDLNLKIYPNPNNGIFNIETMSNSNIEILNVLGQSVYLETLIENKLQLNISAGIYYVKVISGNNRTIKKVICYK